ncbi:ArnT family glycosyltransferase [Actomonas aquatica]|uniref:Glycosyltransferase RgtA/B/C/D-like domain-containing protein n=1 Tax=Actomonas aquatica TaxID=2866162 RepID=A0ABZ1CAE9_9BACT|nr:hypothetical protein [Opitutus sp. WL0086]WRQ88506.1 hypothetical protein K1X11_003765 [Opitutus sp. WL0086]
MPNFTSLRKNWLLLLVAALLTAWIFWLRAPTWSTAIWNVDEAIHTSVADVILDGGVIYRDAIDQRTPLTYYVFAAVYSITGNSLPAMRVVLTAMIVATMLLLGAVVRRHHGNITALLAALTYGALTSKLLQPADAYAVHTEWFVALFSTAAAACFLWPTDRAPSSLRAAASGVLLSLAVLSKQSALLEIGPPFVALAGLLLAKRLGWFGALACGGALLAGLAVPLLITAGLLASAGALDDFWLYGWAYNVKYYGAEISFPDKILSATIWFRLLWEQYPHVLILGSAAAAALVVRALQARASDSLRQARPVEFYLLAWSGLALGSAMAGGRGFDHYFFVCLAPFSWAAAWALRGLTTTLGRLLHLSPRGQRVAATVLAVAFVAPTVWHARLSRTVDSYPLDTTHRLVETVHAYTSDDEPIFIWGYNTDLYTLADRLPASRFLYCSFQTGLIPWTNTAPDIDTSYAILPNAMDDLLADLEASKPPIIVDGSLQEYRGFAKYPLRKFPRLRDWIDAHYVELEPDRIRSYGFAMYRRRLDTPPELDLNAPAAGNQISLEVGNPVSLGRLHIGVFGESQDGLPLTGLALTLEDEVLAAVEIAHAPYSQITIPFTATDEMTTLPFRAWARFGDGPWQPGPSRDVKVMPLTASPEVATTFALPIIDSRVPADGVRSLIDPRLDVYDNKRIFAVHAPSVLRYTLPDAANRIWGFYGIPAGAYAADNTHPTDGAEFIIRLLFADGGERELMRHFIDPASRPEDRGHLRFEYELPSAPGPRVIEFDINPGPTGSASSDWTEWANIVLETSP